MSSALDEDTQQTLAAGRETAGAMLRSAQKDLQKVFIVFLVGFIGTFYALRAVVWDYLRAVTRSQMEAEIAGDLQIIAQTPFDVILLQAKIGLIAGIIVAIPPLLYFSRDALRERGRWPESPVARWKLAGVGMLSAVLFLGGMTYGYSVFFPFMFEFLASNALSAGFSPKWSIVLWTQFIALLSLSFGLAAQMPLAMTGTTAAGIVEYETFRNKWRHAVAGIFVFGAVFSPPDPFTQIMWALPLIFLYGFSLYLSRVVSVAKRHSGGIDVRATAVEQWNVVAGAFVAGAAAVYLFYDRGGVEAANDLLATVGSSYQVGPLGAPLGLPPDAVLGGLAALVGVVAAVAALGVLSLRTVGPAESGTYGDPTAIDLGELDADGVRAAPPEAFAERSEREAVAAAEAAMEADDPEKAQAILNRWEAVNDVDDGGESAQPPLYAPDPGLLGAIRRGAGWVNWRRRLQEVWTVLAGVAVAVFGVGYVLVARRGLLVESALPAVGMGDVAVPNVAAALGVSEAVAVAAVGAVAVAVAAALWGVIALIAAYQAGVDPSAVDLDALATEEIERAPAAVFDALSESAAAFHADRAAGAGDAERASLILDRFDEAQADGDESDEEAEDESDVEGRATRAGGTFLEELTDGERDEDDIGGYYADLRFILDSLTSKTFRIVGLFMGVLAVTFFWLYRGGIGRVYDQFLAQVPGNVTPENAQVIALHPVEALIFEIKFSTLIAGLVTVPVIAYYAWPALRDRGFVRGRRRMIFGWVGVLVAGLVAGFAAGFLYVAPTIISYLVFDALQAEMVISYRITKFFWLIFFTTAGVGLLIDVAIMVVLLNTAGISYQSMRGRWREVTVGMLAAAALLTPASIVTMFLVTVPLLAAYWTGLGSLWLLTLGGRRNLREPRLFREDDDDAVPE